MTLLSRHILYLGGKLDDLRLVPRNMLPISELLGRDVSMISLVSGNQITGETSITTRASDQVDKIVCCVPQEWNALTAIRVWISIWNHISLWGYNYSSPVCLTAYAGPHLRNTKVRVTGPLWGEFTGDLWILPAQRSSDAEKASIWLRHHVLGLFQQIKMSNTIVSIALSRYPVFFAGSVLWSEFQ